MTETAMVGRDARGRLRSRARGKGGSTRQAPGQRQRRLPIASISGSAANARQPWDAVPVRKRVPWPTHSRQRCLHCLVCGNEELCSAGLCRRCYDAAYHSETYFGGLKDAVLARDGRRCQACGDPSDIVHHRQSGRNELAWLITICARCHAVVHRLERLDRYLPPLLIELWREQHPGASVEQLQLAWEAPA